MSSAAGIWPVQKLAPSEATFPHHNVDTTAPGLPVKADHKIYQGVMVAYDPAASEARYADPAQAVTAVVVGVNTGDTVDNTDGAKGDLKISPEAGVFRLANDGNLTAAHLFKRVRVVDDHTVGVPARTDADRFAGILIGLEGTGYVWVLITPTIAQRAPVDLDQASATLAGTLTGTVDGALADIAATAAACAGGSSPSATNVDDAIATAVASIVTGTNTQIKEIQTLLNKLSAALVTHGLIAPNA